MKITFSTLLLLFSFSSMASVIDSVLFSTDGNYVLLCKEDRNDCAVAWYDLYEKGNADFSYIAVYNDSAFVLTYDDETHARSFKIKDCLTNANVLREYSFPDFINKYKLTQSAHRGNTLLTLKIDTLKTYTKKENTETPVYYNLAAHLLMASRIIHTDTVSTNVSDQDFDRKYELYYSADNKYFFVKGSFRVGQYPGTGSYMSTQVNAIILGESDN